MPRLLGPGPFVVLLALAACGDPSDPGATLDDTGDASTGGDASSGAPASSSSSGPVDPTTDGSGPTGPTDTGDDPGTTTLDPGTTSSTGAPDTSTSTTGDPDTSTSTTATPDTTSSTGDPDTSSTGDDTTGGVVDGGELPAPTQPCPELIDGTVEFHPMGVASPRDVRIWLDPAVAAVKDGPVVFYWHGTNGQPDQAIDGLGDMGIQEILDAGGIVVAPTHDPAAGFFPWFLVLGQQQDDLLIADEVLACAQEQIGVDAARIHSLGFSAGGLHTAQMSIRRSSYLASVALYSGGLTPGNMPMFEDPDNKFPAMILHGGASDVVVIGFKQASEDYAAYIAANDNFSFICDHGGGHAIPPVQDDVMQFFADHPWATAPEPYIDALPNGFPDYCILP